MKITNDALLAEEYYLHEERYITKAQIQELCDKYGYELGQFNSIIREYKVEKTSSGGYSTRDKHGSSTDEESLDYQYGFTKHEN